MFELPLTGPFVLMAKKIKALEESYSTISHGGAARPYEIIPSNGVLHYVSEVRTTGSFCTAPHIASIKALPMPM